MMTIQEKLASMVMDQVEKQIDAVATGLLSTDNTTTNAKQYEKASYGDPSYYHHYNNNHENLKDETASNSYAANLDMKDHSMDENIHLQVRHSHQSKIRQDYQQPKMATKLKNPTFTNQNIQSQPVYPMLTGMPLICNTVQQSALLASTIPPRASHPNNRRQVRQVPTLPPRSTHTPDRRHVTVKDRRYAGQHAHKHNNNPNNNQGIHESCNSTRQTTTNYNQEPPTKPEPTTKIFYANQATKNSEDSKNRSKRRRTSSENHIIQL
ncbi:unnamed protein product [Mytilus coruscus]|uniref:Uncharacterized protein n=1 Tax=Mytilus coruscus TaxID=42192 RepID=A0A6J8BRE6_MYTCO|nr:unnamed protein product [Mytilus coruscus]